MGQKRSPFLACVSMFSQGSEIFDFRLAREGIITDRTRKFKKKRTILRKKAKKDEPFCLTARRAKTGGAAGPGAEKELFFYSRADTLLTG